MNVYQLMTALAELPAGAEVSVTAYPGGTLNTLKVVRHEKQALLREIRIKKLRDEIAQLESAQSRQKNGTSKNEIDEVMRKDALQKLVDQAQELDMGYGPSVESKETK